MYRTLHTESTFLLKVGGYQCSKDWILVTPSFKTLIYDPDNDTWSVGTSMPIGRLNAAVSVVDDRLYVIGGEAPTVAEQTVPSAMNEMYTPIGYGTVTPSPTLLPSPSPSPTSTPTTTITPTATPSPSPSPSPVSTSSPSPQATQQPTPSTSAAPIRDNGGVQEDAYWIAAAIIAIAAAAASATALLIRKSRIERKKQEQT